MPESQPASTNKTAPSADPPRGPDVVVRETGTGPFQYLVVDVPAGAHPASLAKALRSLPIACEFVNMADMAGTRSGGELRFRVHDGHGPAHHSGSTYGGIGTRVPRLDSDSPFDTEQPAGGAR
ncbi:hypothetical protein [Parafrankia discariae]|uniref:hypothetical protein n=1 Tax=Parafrankia discariae TaxID=365528 RepID=UPI00047818AA|nr:hypothetical protein [Parafrankia discariae]